VTSISTAIRELIELLVERTDANREGTRLRIGVECDAAGEDIFVRIESNGPEIPAVEREVLDAGSETPLQHAERLGLWLAYWWVTENSGSLHVDDPGRVVDVTDAAESDASDDDADSLLTVVVVRLPGAECARTSEARPHSE
jgi:signal transduction histidine kinase